MPLPKPQWSGVPDPLNKDGKAILVYARPKSGKSRLLATAPGPVLVLDFDNNFPINDLPPELQKKVARLVPRTYEQLLEICQAFKPHESGFGITYDGDRFNTIGEDTVTQLYPMILEDALRLPVDRKIAALTVGKSTPETNPQREIPAQSDYGLAGERIKNHIKKMRQLPVHFIAIGHEELYSFRADDKAVGKISADNTVRAGLSLTPSLNDKVPGYFNLFLRIKVDNPGSEKPKPEHYKVWSVQSDYFFPAGDATNRLDPQEPADLTHIIRKAGGYIPADHGE